METGIGEEVVSDDATESAPVRAIRGETDGGVIVGEKAAGGKARTGGEDEIKSGEAL